MSDLKEFYGVKIHNNVLLHYGVAKVRRLIRVVFLAPSVNCSLAGKIIEQLNDRYLENLDDMVAILEKELDEVKKLLLSIQNPANDFKKKYLDWLDKIGNPMVVESFEYFDFFRISRSDLHKLSFPDLEGKGILTGPVDIKTILDQFVIGQEEAKKQLSFAFYLHMIRNGLVTPAMKLATSAKSEKPIELPKPRMILIGPTGSGKTFMINTLCDKFKIPFIKIDCASLTASGYVGKAIDEYFYLLVKKNDFNFDNVTKALVYFDEFDKLRESGYSQNSGSVGGKELQQEFLSVIEDREILIQPPRGSQNDSFTLNAANMMFVFSGSFSGIEKLIHKKLNHTGIGFKKHSKKTKPITQDDLYLHIEQQDLIEFGIIPELAGRINFIVPVKGLGKQDILDILKKSEFSPLKAYENFFRIHGDELIMTDEVLVMIAEEVLKNGTGARGITTVLQKLLGEFLFECPDFENKTYTITPEYFMLKFQL